MLLACSLVLLASSSVASPSQSRNTEVARVEDRTAADDYIGVSDKVKSANLAIGAAVPALTDLHAALNSEGLKKIAVSILISYPNARQNPGLV